MANLNSKNRISVIVFDLGNVLIPFSYDKFLGELNSRQKGLGEEFALRYKEYYDVHRNFEKGKMSKQEFLEIMMEWTNFQMTEEEFCYYFSDIFDVNETAVDLLPYLKKNYSLVLLSNTNEIHMEYGWSKYEFLKYFDKLILSHEVGAAKPEREIYKAVEEFTERAPEEHIFIDDIKEYTEAAEKLGWKAIHFIDNNNLLIGLRAKGIDLNGFDSIQI